MKIRKTCSAKAHFTWQPSIVECAPIVRSSSAHQHGASMRCIPNAGNLDSTLAPKPVMTMANKNSNMQKVGQKANVKKTSPKRSSFLVWDECKEQRVSPAQPSTPRWRVKDALQELYREAGRENKEDGGGGSCTVMSGANQDVAMRLMANFDRPTITEHAQRLENLYLRRGPITPRRPSKPSTQPFRETNIRERWKLVSPPTPNVVKTPRRRMVSVGDWEPTKSPWQVDVPRESGQASNADEPVILHVKSLGSAFRLARMTMVPLSFRTPVPPLVKKPSKVDASWDRYKIAKDYNISLREVAYCQDLFSLVDTDHSGCICYSEFVQLVKIISDSGSNAENAAKHISWWYTADRNQDGSISFDEFVAWFTSHSFDEDLWLKPEQLLSRIIAKEMNLSLIDVENVKNKFDYFDSDGSGKLEYNEFYDFMVELLEVPKSVELPHERVKYFWQQLDLNIDESIGFREFLVFYKKYFGIKNGPLKVSPFEQLYQKVRPGLGICLNH
eukprot:GEMP01027635.1.p1 GENE.GEMP01027635.1~~GEMP01027635.1.p1  ORF type:complete len:501 (+),score=70.22 GEMP01027635.1:66-1568(+)